MRPVGYGSEFSTKLTHLSQRGVSEVVPVVTWWWCRLDSFSDIWLNYSFAFSIIHPSGVLLKPPRRLFTPVKTELSVLLSNVSQSLTTVIETRRGKQLRAPETNKTRLRRNQEGWGRGRETPGRVLNAWMGDQYPTKVQVSVEETTAEGRDPGEDTSPL